MGAHQSYRGTEEMILSFQTGFNLVNVVVVCAILESVLGSETSSDDSHTSEKRCFIISLELHCGYNNRMSDSAWQLQTSCWRRSAWGVNTFAWRRAVPTCGCIPGVVPYPPVAVFLASYTINELLLGVFLVLYEIYLVYTLLSPTGGCTSGT